MVFIPQRHHRRSIRLAECDYGAPGAYFLTICTRVREYLFGEVVAGEMRLNPIGVIVCEEWLKTGEMRARVDVEAFVIMPNHLHGILVINENDPEQEQLCDDITGRVQCNDDIPGHVQPYDYDPGHVQRAPTVERFGGPTSDSIPTIVRLFKSVTMSKINALRNSPGEAVLQCN